MFRFGWKHVKKRFSSKSLIYNFYLKKPDTDSKYHKFKIANIKIKKCEEKGFSTTCLNPSRGRARDFKLNNGTCSCFVSVRWQDRNTIQPRDCCQCSRIFNDVDNSRSFVQTMNPHMHYR